MDDIGRATERRPVLAACVPGIAHRGRRAERDGQLQAFGVLIFPKITLVLVFLLMAAVLVVKPWGLLGRPEAAAVTRP